MGRLACVGWAIVLLACGQGVGPDGVIVGGDCDVSEQCAPQARCITGERFPDGYCTKRCATPSDCPGGSSCVEEQGGTCMLDCTGGGGCRTGYQCMGLDVHGAEGSAMVCVNPPL